MNAHTPGPWTFYRAKAFGHMLSKTFVGADGQGFARTVGLGEPIDTANALLIASAPALLDALRAFCGDHEATGMECAGLNTAYLHAKALIADIDAGIARGVK